MKGLCLAVMGIVGMGVILLPSPVSAQCLPPACEGNIAGKIHMLQPGPFAVSLQGEVEPGGTLDPTRASLHWTFDPTYLFADATQPPDAPPILMTPDAFAASSMTYRAQIQNAQTGTASVIINNVTCDQALLECWTGPLLSALPGLSNGGTFTVSLSWEKLPQFHQSTWSAPVLFTVLGGQPPPPPPGVNCVPGEWSAWSPWVPQEPQVVPPMLIRMRTREILAPASGGGADCFPLLQTETMLLTPPPISAFCRYVKPGTTVVQTVAAGTRIVGTNQMATQSTRMAVLVGWGFELNATKCLTALNGACQTVHVEATCRGLP